MNKAAAMKIPLTLVITFVIILSSLFAVYLLTTEYDIFLKPAEAKEQTAEDRLGPGDIVHYAIKPSLKGIVLFGSCEQVWRCEYEVRFVDNINNLYTVKNLNRYELVKE